MRRKTNLHSIIPPWHTKEFSHTESFTSRRLYGPSLWPDTGLRHDLALFATMFIATCLPSRFYRGSNAALRLRPLLKCTVSDLGTAKKRDHVSIPWYGDTFKYLLPPGRARLRTSASTHQVSIFVRSPLAMLSVTRIDSVKACRAIATPVPRCEKSKLSRRIKLSLT